MWDFLKKNTTRKSSSSNTKKSGEERALEEKALLGGREENEDLYICILGQARAKQPFFSVSVVQAFIASSCSPALVLTPGLVHISFVIVLVCFPDWRQLHFSTWSKKMLFGVLLQSWKSSCLGITILKPY